LWGGVGGFWGGGEKGQGSDVVMEFLSKKTTPKKPKSKPRHKQPNRKPKRN
jgi:hypothetical protein